jgi:hypothetical protein
MPNESVASFTLFVLSADALQVGDYFCHRASFVVMKVNTLAKKHTDAEEGQTLRSSSYSDGDRSERPLR